jgi:hypothetical protein
MLEGLKKFFESGGFPMSLSAEQQTVLNLINEKELVDLAVAMSSITAPSGYEQPMADYVLQWLKTNGFDDSFQQLVSDGRSNTIGVLRGAGASRKLIFNSHMDSEQGMPTRVGEELPKVREPGSTRTSGESSAKPCKTTAARWPLS